jgi:hypothetical protein
MRSLTANTPCLETEHRFALSHERRRHTYGAYVKRLVLEFIKAAVRPTVVGCGDSVR